MRLYKNPTSIALTFIWIGFVCAISFVEAWIKFQAPGVTLEVGLGIGKLVFNALNRVEWVLSIIILISMIRLGQNPIRGKNLLITISVLILILQTFWLLPELFERANMHIQEQNISSSSFAHYAYIIVEVIKVVLLTTFGISLLRNK